MKKMDRRQLQSRLQHLTQGMGSVTPNQKAHAALQVAQWASERPDPEDSLRELLEALGLVDVVLRQTCRSCGQDKPRSQYDVTCRWLPVLTCRECRSEQRLAKEKKS